MRIVITGASGNFGTALLRQLALDHGEHRLIGVSRRRPPRTPPYDRADWVEADLSQPDSSETLVRTFDGADAVVHLAWRLQPAYDRELLRRTNQGGTQRVGEAVAQAGVPHLVHASSLGVYSPRRHRSPVIEDWPREGIPSSSYSVDKAAAERFLDRLEQESPTLISRIRPGLILQGAAASEISRYFLPRWLLPSLIRPGVLRFVPLPVDFSLQLVHANDVARAVIAILEHRAGGAFNVVSDPVLDRSSWGALFGGIGPAAPVPWLRRAVDLSWRLHLQPTDPGWIDLASCVPVLSSARIRALGWAPAHRSDEVLVEFFRGLARRTGIDGPLLHPR